MHLTVLDERPPGEGRPRHNGLECESRPSNNFCSDGILEENWRK
jgi:hypothetical protein